MCSGLPCALSARLQRRRRAAVRLEISADPDQRLKKWLTEWLQLRAEDVYEIEGMLDAAALMELVGRGGLEDLKLADWPPQLPPITPPWTEVAA